MYAINSEGSTMLEWRLYVSFLECTIQGIIHTKELACLGRCS